MKELLYKCPKCKSKMESHMDLQKHMFNDCKYSYWVAVEVADKQKEKIEKLQADA